MSARFNTWQVVNFYQVEPYFSDFGLESRERLGAVAMAVCPLSQCGQSNLRERRITKMDIRSSALGDLKLRELYEAISN
ncbi:hypothetical protein, partial [Burkholderia vietnamiensis]